MAAFTSVISREAKLTCAASRHRSAGTAGLVRRRRETAARVSDASGSGRGVERRAGDLADQAARTESRNLPTSSLRRLLSLDSDCAAESTCEDADPASLAPRCTSVMLEDTCWVP